MLGGRNEEIFMIYSDLMRHRMWGACNLPGDVAKCPSARPGRALAKARDFHS